MELDFRFQQVHRQIGDIDLFIPASPVQKRHHMGIGLADNGEVHVVKVHQPFDGQVADHRPVHELQPRHVGQHVALNVLLHQRYRREDTRHCRAGQHGTPDQQIG